MNDDIDIIYILHSAFGTSLGDLTSESLFFIYKTESQFSLEKNNPFFVGSRKKKFPYYFDGKM